MQNNRREQGRRHEARKLERLTIIEMLDALEAGIEALRTRSSTRVTEVRAGANGDGIPPSALEALMKRASLSKSEFSAAFGVHPSIVEKWLTGKEPAPAWVLVSVRSLALLNLSQRSGILNGHHPRIVNGPPNTHPFSRIEEL